MKLLKVILGRAHYALHASHFTRIITPNSQKLVIPHHTCIFKVCAIFVPTR